MGIGKEEKSEMEQSIEIEECSSSSEEESNHPNTDIAEEPEVRVRRSTREKHRPDFYGVWVHSVEDVNREPVTVSQTLSGSESQEWKVAMEIEMNSMYKNDVWELVPLPEGRQVIGCKWIFKWKTGADGSVNCYKARLVAQGTHNSQNLTMMRLFPQLFILSHYLH